MQIIIQWLGAFLGFIMRGCYSLVQNYGLAIVLFTFLSKIILLPVSIWSHKSSITMVKMMPAINNIKANFFGDRDRIAEEQSKLYKKEEYNPFASIVPLLLQLVLLIGIIEVIYHPMNYILSIPQDIIDGFVTLSGQLAPISLEASSVQLSVIDLMKNPQFAPRFLELGGTLGTEAVAQAVSSVQALDMIFLGFNLSWIPNTTYGISLLIPVLAGVSAWLLAFIQNKINVLQVEQSKFNQYGMMFLSIALSLFLALFVPVGVGFYWIWSNLFAILQLIFLNAIISPKKHVDYEALEESRQVLAQLEDLEPKRKPFQRNPNRRRERQDYKRFFSIANKHFVIYSEASGFYKYFKNVIDYLLETTNLTIHYVTNDPDDAVFQMAKKQPKIQPYYIGPKRIITLMMKMDAEIVLMTTPDLENYHIKRSYIKEDVEYIYIDHGIGSSHMALKKGALDHFDTIFAVGQHQVNELREGEKMYSLPKKTIVPVGYGLIEDMIETYEATEHPENNPKQILIAPSWQEDNLLDLCIDPILKELLQEDYKIIVRPHPEYVKRYPLKVSALKERYQQWSKRKLEFQTDFTSNKTVFLADAMITDWSNISMEYSFTTKKPTLFINTPPKIFNVDYHKYENKALDEYSRTILGEELEVEGIPENIAPTIERFLVEKDHYAEQIKHLLEKSVFNLGSSGQVAGDYIIGELQKRQAKD